MLTCFYDPVCLLHYHEIGEFPIYYAGFPSLIKGLLVFKISHSRGKINCPESVYVLLFAVQMKKTFVVECRLNSR